MTRCRCIEVDGISKIHTAHRVQGRLINILRIERRAQNNYVVGVESNGGDNLLMVWFDKTLPALPNGFIERLKENIWEVPVLLCHFSKENVSLRRMLVCVVIMPVNDNIDADINGGINDSLNLRLFN